MYSIFSNTRVNTNTCDSYNFFIILENFYVIRTVFTNKTITRKKFNIYGTIFDDISVNLKNNIKILFIDIINDP